MKLDYKLLNSIPLLIGLFFLLIGQLIITWIVEKIIFYPVNESTILEIQPVKCNPQIYWLEIVDNRIKLIPKSAYTTAKTSQKALTEAFYQLFHKPSNSALTTTIPEQTNLLNLDIYQDDIYINLSEEFSENDNNSSMIYPVAQVLYTATSLDPQGQVFLSIEGKPLNQNYPLGKEGLLLEYPLTRQKFLRDFLTE